MSAGALGRYVSLTLALAAREYPGSYRGNLMGALAGVLVPVAMLATYSIVFTRLIPISVGPDRSEDGYVFFLFAGLVVWNLFADVVVRAPSLLRGAAHFVKRPGFPVSIIVLAPCVASLYRSLPWLGVFVIAQLVMGRSFGWPSLLSLAVLAGAFVLTAGISLVVAVVGVLVKDMSEITPPIMTLLFFLSPVLYPAEKLESLDASLVLLNPMASILEAMRATLLDQVVPDGQLVLRIVVACFVSLLMGSVLFRWIRSSLMDRI